MNGRDKCVREKDLRGDNQGVAFSDSHRQWAGGRTAGSAALAARGPEDAQSRAAFKLRSITTLEH